MGKAEMCIKMLEFLNTGRTYKVSELAGMLDTKERNIIEYKNLLTGIGYNVKSVSGRYGGYYLDKSNLMPSIKLTAAETAALSSGFNYLMSRNDFLEKESFEKAMAKIYSSIANKEFENEVSIINRYPLSMSEEELKLRYNAIEKCIKNNQVLSFRYLSLKNKEKEYEFDPYELFMYNNAWFMIGWNHNFGQISYFKLNRINEYKITDKRFEIWKLYNRNDYLDEYGFKKNGDWYHIEFEAYNSYAALVKERIYGKNQEVIPINETTTLVKVDMQNKENILVFILGFNRNLKVIEPQWLIDELKEYVSFIRNLYLSKY